MLSYDWQGRIARLLTTSNADALAIVPGANMVYFTGLHFHLSERPTIALLSRDGLAFIIPELETPKLDRRPDLNARRFVWSDGEGYEGAFRRAVEELGLKQKRVGVDGMTMRVYEALALQAAGLPAEAILDESATLLHQRAIKTAEEIAAIRRAIAISETALQNTLAWAKPGMTEKAIATKLADELMSNGSQGDAFAPIVLTGPNSALPHGGTGERVWGEGEFLLIDYGCLYDDYPSDITRTFYAGPPNGQLREIYEAVYRANEAAIATAKPGVSGHDVDKAAREVIAAAGYGDYFIHRTGHGLGLQGHEWPNIAPNNTMTLEVGMVFTIEPGIYLPGVGGVRIEDDVLVTEGGVDVLTRFPKAWDKANLF